MQIRSVPAAAIPRGCTNNRRDRGPPGWDQDGVTGFERFAAARITAAVVPDP